MSMQSFSQAPYDRAITVFSPNGRLFQVEYAKEAIKRGATAIGVEYQSGIMLGIDKRLSSEFMKEESIEKIYKIDEHIGVATSGLVADGRKLVDYARIIAQQERMNFNEEIDTTKLTKEICDLKQKYTQYGGTRPFGVSLLIAGVGDDGKYLYRTDPSGAYVSYKATAIGRGEEDLKSFMHKNYKEDMTKDEAVKFVLKALKEVKEEEFDEKVAEIAYIDESEGRFSKLGEEDIAKHVEEM